MLLGNSPSLIYYIAGGVTLLLGIIASLGFLALRKSNVDSAYDEQLADLLASDFDDDDAEVTLAIRWNRYWGERFQSMGWRNYADNHGAAGRDAILVVILIMIVAGFLTKNILAGTAISALMIYIIGVAMKSKANRDADVLNAQLPGFLFALKANIQANETPERAILKIVDNMPSPLYEDLVVVKQRILANSSFQSAIEEMGQKTTSRDLKFLCACMIQATQSGASLEGQITVIQSVINDRRKVSDELAKAVRSATPAIWVASFVIPAIFVATLMMDPGSKEFWFHEPLSWAAFAGIILLYSAGLWFSKKLVDGIKNL